MMAEAKSSYYLPVVPKSASKEDLPNTGSPKRPNIARKTVSNTATYTKSSQMRAGARSNLLNKT